MKQWIFVLGSVMGLALAGCGGGGGSNKALCIETCEKFDECFDMESDCEADCSEDGNGGGSCNNEGEIVDHIEMCNAGECGENGMTYSECVGMTPECEM